MEKMVIAEKTGGALALALMVVFLIAAIYDIIALFSEGRYATISLHIVDWSKKWPIIPFFAGFLIGHLFFPPK